MLVLDAIQNGFNPDGLDCIETSGCMKDVKGKVRYRVDGEHPGWKIDWFLGPKHHNSTYTTSITHGAVLTNYDFTTINNLEHMD